MLRRRPWTDEQLCELIELWPTHSVAQIAKRLHRSPKATRERARRLLKEGVLEGTIASQNMLDRARSMTILIRPDLQDFVEVKRDYCRKHHIDIAELSARFESDERFAAELYRLAQAAKQARLTDAPTCSILRASEDRPDADGEREFG